MSDIIKEPWPESPMSAPKAAMDLKPRHPRSGPYRGRLWHLWIRVKYLPYRPIQRLLHRLNLHYMPPIYPDGDTLLWCQWCGVRDVISRRSDDPDCVRPVRA